ncbi:hypothetical protein ACH5RR_022752 [Cinchona calisaya]|uniref:Uncharacterized protein n=1 Tax=Cinchona calisaya TaxID=153742 RepID=A0ABD2ZC28_9GENT
MLSSSRSSSRIITKSFIKNQNKIVLSFCSHDDEGKSLRILAPDYELPLTPSRWIDLLGTCNGIVCMSDMYSGIYLCNPAIRDLYPNYTMETLIGAHSRHQDT